MKAFWNPVQLTHAPAFFLVRGEVRANFEVPARAAALLEACRGGGMEVTMPHDAGREVLGTVHPAAYLDFLEHGFDAWAALGDAGPEMVANVHPSPEMLANGAVMPAHITGQTGWFTADTACPIGRHTWAASAAAAAGAIAAADEAAAGRSAYALARPPGHHTYAARAGGHCYLNNAALAAERLLAKGAKRVAVLDIDSHHGNGTQGIFYDRADVLFVSVHGDPNRYYPWYTGHAAERGSGAGEGFNLNFPLALGTGDEGWLAATASGMSEIQRFGAEALVVSLGFDASKDEPLNALSVTSDGFARAGAAIGAARLPAAIVQEGGYNVDVLGPLLTRFLEGFGASSSF
jgi:acetoin utilization deacetylase AcuC-like enzyme